MTRLLLLSCVALFSFSACIKDSVKPNHREVDLGDLHLLQSSIDAMPYAGHSGMVYVDSAGNEMVMTISNYVPIQLPGKIKVEDTNSPGDSITFLYNPERIFYNFENTENGLQHTIQLSTFVGLSTFFTEDKSWDHFISDRLYIVQFLPAESYFSSIFYSTIAQRTTPSGWDFPPREVGDTILLGKQFSQVLQDEWALSTTNHAFFNYTYGILYFADHTGRHWRFDRWQ